MGLGIFGFLFGGGTKGVKGIASGIKSVAEVFVPNATQRMSKNHDSYIASTQQFGAELATPKTSWFGRMIDGLNRLPRPMIAFGVIGLFVFAGISPVEFAVFMNGIALIPEMLWLLIMAVVTYYFAARELQYKRDAKTSVRPEQIEEFVQNVTRIRSISEIKPLEADLPDADFDDVIGSDEESNSIIDEWNSKIPDK